MTTSDSLDQQNIVLSSTANNNSSHVLDSDGTTSSATAPAPKQLCNGHQRESCVKKKALEEDCSADETETMLKK